MLFALTVDKMLRIFVNLHVCQCIASRTDTTPGTRHGGLGYFDHNDNLS